MIMQLQYEDIVVGTGKSASRGALICANYTGFLPNGEVFDSSHSRGQPFECVIGTGRVIKGWDIGVLGGEYADKIGYADYVTDAERLVAMKVGGKRRLIVPSHLAYGERAVGKIPPNSDLTFEIELLDVKTRDD
ncbi:FKBP-type peptidyl-prolyl cis-trans isomerase [Moraxella nasovis]|uniref:FKBP-type peptidyl-prolyl cis-trans isomerase n=1 Tax=Moraxella nasovis TaxID=2904121 RepID=UPI001F60F6B8|nr:FKBP-type peptidyl-prolyl cis-trans isomerase [Moraxella nasovis]UNU74302.1 FKBP-type peptidyl-prolyl cis-trans isomerase [Moraxella nasovis]